MSQKRSDFQSKPKFGGQKFGGKGRGPGDGAKRPPRKDFGERSEGDRGGDRPYKKPRFEGGGGERREGGYQGRPRGDKPYGDKPRGDRPYGDKPAYAKKPYGDRAPRGDKPFGDRPPRGDRPYGDKPAYAKKPYGDRAPRGDKPFGDRPRGKFGDKKPYEKKSFGDRPRGDRPYGDKPRGDRPYGDKPAYAKKPYGDRPPRGDKPFGDKKPYEKKSFDRDDRAGDRRPQKSWQRYDDRPKKFDGAAAERGPASAETRGKLKSERSAYGAPSSAFLYGTHAVTEALKNPKRLHQRLLCTERGFEAISDVFAAGLESGLKMPEITYVEKDDISRLLPREAVHQDLLLDSQPLEEVFLIDVINSLPENAKVLVLDQVTDPHNVGAILRSAAAFGASAVIAQKLHAPDITGTLAKAASGAAEHVPFVREVNLSRALEQLKEAGFFCIGLAEEGKQTIASLKLTGKVALVLGAEGDGLRRLVAENCDELVKLPTGGAIGSLNVSNAAAVALYELVR